MNYLANNGVFLLNIDPRRFNTHWELFMFVYIVEDALIMACPLPTFISVGH